MLTAPAGTELDGAYLISRAGKELKKSILAVSFCSNVRDVLPTCEADMQRCTGRRASQARNAFQRISYTCYRDKPSWMIIVRHNLQQIASLALGNRSAQAHRVKPLLLQTNIGAGADLSYSGTTGQNICEDVPASCVEIKIM